MSQKGPFIVLRLVALLLLIGLMVGGGYMAYHAGVAQGVSQAPAVATAISHAAENGQVAPVPPMAFQQSYGYGPGFYPLMGGFHHFGFFPFGICGAILFVFFFFALLRMIFFRPWHRGWGHHGHGPWGRHWEGGAPPMFTEWHKRAHGETPPSDSESPKTES
jgi:hypothetical protein